MWRSLFFCVSVGLQIHLFIMAELTLRRLSGERTWVCRNGNGGKWKTSSRAIIAQAQRQRDWKALHGSVARFFSLFHAFQASSNRSTELSKLKGEKRLKNEAQNCRTMVKKFFPENPTRKNFFHPQTSAQQPPLRGGKFSVPNKRELLLLGGENGESGVKFSKTFPEKASP